MPTQDLTRNANATIGVTSSVIAQACFQERVLITVVNTSSAGQVVSLGIGQEAVAGAGIVLYPGGVYTENKSDKSDLITQDQLNAIADVAGATIAITERVRTEVR